MRTHRANNAESATYLVRRGFRFVALSLIALVGMSGCGQESTVVSASPEQRAVDVTTARPGHFYVSDLGVRVGVRTRRFQENTLVDEAVVVTGEQRNGYPYPLDGSDPDAPLDPLPIGAGFAILVEGGVNPDCDHPDSLIPSVDVTYRSVGGSAKRMSIRLSNPDAFVAAARDWCENNRELNLSLGGSGQWPDGRFYIEETLTNPTDETVHFVSEEFDGPDGHYEYAEADVAPRSQYSLKVRGNGEGCSHEGPWAYGLVTADGEPLPAPSESECEADPC